MKMMLRNIWGDISGYISTKVWNLAALNNLKFKNFNIILFSKDIT